MFKLFALVLWTLALVALLFNLAVSFLPVAPVLHFVGAVALGVMYPSLSWAIVKRYPESDRAAWVCLGITGGIIALLALLRLVRF